MKKIILAGVASVALALPAFADVYLPGHQVAGTVIGNTIEGQYRECGGARNDFKEYYDPNGQIRGHERPCNQAGSWSTYQGAWEVKDGKFCVNLGSGRSNGCFDYQAQEDGTLTRANEPGVGNTNFKVYDGNPEGL